MSDQPKCGCGRSRSGFCDGSHGLTEAQWAKLSKQYATDPFLNGEFLNRNKEESWNLKNWLKSILKRFQGKT